jgi:hypothetical protein
LPFAFAVWVGAGRVERARVRREILRLRDSRK